MDNTDIYIKMCAKAKDIQKHVLEAGDFIQLNRNEHNQSAYGIVLSYPFETYYLLFADGHQQSYDVMGANHTWLPRQDQLQEMVSEHFKSGLDLCNLFAWYERNRPKDVSQEWDSMEQLWLAFTMKEKFDKVWSIEKEDWVSKK